MGLPITYEVHQIMSVQRPKRLIKRSSRAQELIDAGESVPGSPITSEDGLSYITDTEVPRSNLAPDRFQIYNWEQPRPQNFLDLSTRRKRWKDCVDRIEKAEDVIDGSDDWNKVCGAPGMSLERIVANVFMHRAKRAFWAGMSWEAFETAERLCKSTKRVNEVRVVVFDVLKYRLCEEIWLKPYYEAAPKRSSPDREDSKTLGSEDQNGYADFETSEEDED